MTRRIDSGQPDPIIGTGDPYPWALDHQASARDDVIDQAEEWPATTVRSSTDAIMVTSALVTLTAEIAALHATLRERLPHIPTP